MLGLPSLFAAKLLKSPGLVRYRVYMRELGELRRQTEGIIKTFLVTIPMSSLENRNPLREIQNVFNRHRVLVELNLIIQCNIKNKKKQTQ